MSIYYLKSTKNNINLQEKKYDTLDEALYAAKVITRKFPNVKIEILKCMGLVSYIETVTGEHEEVFFN